MSTDLSLQQMWDERYRAAAVEDTAPARVLQDYAHLLPARGSALDLACGLGGNALLLARCGLTTHAWDLSPVAIEKLQACAQRQGLDLHAQVRDVSAAPPPEAGFDVIVVTRFLERGLAPALGAALRPGGLLYYQTYLREAVSDSGPKNPQFRLEANELLRMFHGLRVLAYREEGTVGDVARGWRDEAMLVALRPE